LLSRFYSYISSFGGIYPCRRQ